MLAEIQKANLPGSMDQRLDFKVNIVAELEGKDLGNERTKDAESYLLWENCGSQISVWLFCISWDLNSTTKAIVTDQNWQLLPTIRKNRN